jgi:hypothetical protein
MVAVLQTLLLMLFSDDLLINHHLWLVLLTEYEMPVHAN